MKIISSANELAAPSGNVCAAIGMFDGVHLGQADLPAPEARKLVGGQLLIGVSTSAVSSRTSTVSATSSASVQ